MFNISIIYLPFWVVIRTGSEVRREGNIPREFNPTKIHSNQREAIEEAQRLAIENPGSIFTVLKSQEAYKASRPKPEQIHFLTSDLTCVKVI